jgi:uncharacterized protein
MLEVGKFNRLKILLKSSSGYYLEGENDRRIFLPFGNIPDHIELQGEVDVFVYLDAHGNPTATMFKPYAQVDEFAWLKVSAVNDTGAFLDWGLPKDLLVPFSEQVYPLEVGKRCLVKIYYDQAKGIAATTYFEDYLQTEVFYLKAGQAVGLLIAEKTELGFKAIVENKFWGLLYQNEIFQTLRKGQKVTGYIKRIRDDRRIDLSLYPIGYEKVEEIAERILSKLKHQAGFLGLGDKSSPDTIYAEFGVSKKVFKQAIGALYKRRLINIADFKIELTKADHTL